MYHNSELGCSFWSDNRKILNKIVVEPVEERTFMGLTEGELAVLEKSCKEVGVDFYCNLAGTYFEFSKTDGLFPNGNMAKYIKDGLQKWRQKGPKCTFSYNFNLEAKRDHYREWIKKEESRNQEAEWLGVVCASDHIEDTLSFKCYGGARTGGKSRSLTSMAAHPYRPHLSVDRVDELSYVSSWTNDPTKQLSYVQMFKEEYMVPATVNNPIWNTARLECADDMRFYSRTYSQWMDHFHCGGSYRSMAAAALGIIESEVTAAEIGHIKNKFENWEAIYNGKKNLEYYSKHSTLSQVKHNE